jgi:hypothetical protein
VEIEVIPTVRAREVLFEGKAVVGSLGSGLLGGIDEWREIERCGPEGEADDREHEQDTAASHRPNPIGELAKCLPFQ